MAIIALFSGSHCHANEVVDGVSRDLGYELIGDRLFEATSRRFGVPAGDLRNSLAGSGSFFDKFTNTRDKNIASLRLILAELIQSDNAIVHGSEALLLPRTISHILRVCVIANHDHRLSEAVSEKGWSEKEATREIHDDDKRNYAWTDYLYGKPAYDPSLYDMLIPMHDRTVAEAVQAICRQARSEAVQATERSRRAADDFVLSAQVGLKLAEEGLAADVHSENGEVILSINKNVVRLNHYRESLVKAAEQVPGVKSASTRLGPRYRPASTNPWSNVEGPPRFMLVDDEKEFVHTLSERLRSRDLESSIAYDGEQALDMAREKAPAVMVLDLMMPGIDGIETLRRLKKDHPEVEVIILTGHGSDLEKQQAEELGAYAYLHKPVDIDTLARVMREAYNRRGRSSEE